MSALPPFALHRPESLPEVADLLAAHRGDAALYAGGTELLLLLKERVLHVGHLIDVKRVPGLGEITPGTGRVLIGATVTHSAVERSSVLRATCPIVPAVARHVANVRVRSVGTVGGNLAFADPHSDLATLFLALDGRVRSWWQGREREVPLRELVRGPYETALEADEILTGVQIAPWPARTIGIYLKFGMYERPTLGVAVALTLDESARAVSEARIAVGCVSARPSRLHEIEARVAGCPVGDLSVDAGRLAIAAAEVVEPVDDLHGSGDYKRDMTRVFVRRALEIVSARAMGRLHDPRYAHTVIVTSDDATAAPSLAARTG